MSELLMTMRSTFVEFAEGTFETHAPRYTMNHQSCHRKEILTGGNGK